MELIELKILLNHPDQLKIEVEKLRLDASTSHEIKGFITLYDHFQGNSIEIEKYLKETERRIKTSSISGKKNFNFLKYAAIVLVIFGIGSLIYFSYSNSKEKLEISNLYKDPGIPIFMSEKTKINWGELMFAIENETSIKAVNIWKKIQKSAPENDTVLYYGGIVYRNAFQYKKANHYFKANLKIPSVFHEQSLYFIAINEWKKGKKNKAKKLLIKLQKSKNQDLRHYVNINLKDLTQQN